MNSDYSVKPVWIYSAARPDVGIIYRSGNQWDMVKWNKGTSYDKTNYCLNKNKNYPFRLFLFLLLNKTLFLVQRVKVLFKHLVYF